MIVQADLSELNRPPAVTRETVRQFNRVQQIGPEVGIAGKKPHRTIRDRASGRAEKNAVAGDDKTRFDDAEFCAGAEQGPARVETDPMIRLFFREPILPVLVACSVAPMLFVCVLFRSISPGVSSGPKELASCCPFVPFAGETSSLKHRSVGSAPHACASVPLPST